MTFPSLQKVKSVVNPILKRFGFERSSVLAKVVWVVVCIGVVVYIVLQVLALIVSLFSSSAATTNYTATNSGVNHGIINAGGTVNGFPPPWLSYNFMAPAELQRDGLYHVKVAVGISYIGPEIKDFSDHVSIDKKFSCSAIPFDKKTLPVNVANAIFLAFEGEERSVNGRSAVAQILECTSRFPVEDTGNLFELQKVSP